MKSSYRNSKSANRNRNKNRTSFSNVEIREYKITIGDNPGVSKGPPISLDWKYDSKNTTKIPLKDYEDNRGPRRNKDEMHMNGKIRTMRLFQESDVSLKDMERASKAAETVREQRKKSANELMQSQSKKFLSKTLGAFKKK